MSDPILVSAFVWNRENGIGIEICAITRVPRAFDPMLRKGSAGTKGNGLLYAETQERLSE